MSSEKQEILDTLASVELALNSFMLVYEGGFQDEYDVAAARKRIRKAGGVWAFASKEIEKIRNARDRLDEIS